MVLPLPRAFTLTATLAVGCLVSRLVTKSAPPILRDSSSRQLRGRKRGSRAALDPKTVVFKQTALALTDEPASADSAFARDVDYDLKYPCGDVKCFFLSLSDPAKGYLVWGLHTGTHELSRRRAQEAYDYALGLESEYGIRHFYAGRPFAVEIPGDFFERLTDQDRAPFVGAAGLAVEPSRTAPAGSAIFKCLHGGDAEIATLEYIIGHGGEGTRQRLMEELFFTKLLVEVHPELDLHFQIMIDLEGKIYHLDFDRVTNTHKTAEAWLQGSTKACLEEAIAYVKN